MRSLMIFMVLFLAGCNMPSPPPPKFKEGQKVQLKLPGGEVLQGVVENNMSWGEVRILYLNKEGSVERIYMMQTLLQAVEE